MQKYNSKRVYNAYYGDFKGVDFSSDHTQVNAQRFSYLCNMYRDYLSGQGRAIETVPGFRRRAALPNEAKIYGIHHFEKIDKNNKMYKVYIHSGKNLYCWNGYGTSDETIYESDKVIDIYHIKTYTVINSEREIIDIEHSIFGDYMYILYEENVDTGSVLSVEDDMKKSYQFMYQFDEYSQKYYLKIMCETDFSGINLTVTMKNGKSLVMNEHASSSFVFDNCLYIIDGNNIIKFNGSYFFSIDGDPYIPKTYVSLPVGTLDEIEKYRYEEENLLTDKQIIEYVCDGVNKSFLFPIPVGEISYLVLNGYIRPPTEVTMIYDNTGASRGFYFDQSVPFPENYKVTVAVTKFNQSLSDFDGEKSKILDCTQAAVYDNRIFLSGNSNYPNSVFFCETRGNHSSDYFKKSSVLECGIGKSGVKTLLQATDSLVVLKQDSQQDASIFYVTPKGVDNPIETRQYNIINGISGIGCVSTGINFLDDPIFISRFGVEGIERASTDLERSIEHRSSMVDAMLNRLDLKNAQMYEFLGYLWLLCEGRIFLSDSRQVFRHDSGEKQYEWYFLDDIGVYDGQYKEYTFASIPNGEIYLDIDTRVYENIENIGKSIIDNSFVFSSNECYIFDGESTVHLQNLSVPIYFYFDRESGKNYLCETKNNYTGGVFKKAGVMKVLEDNIFFGTDNGVICSFNFDKRKENGEIPTEYYSFNGRTIFSGCATKMDNCNHPNFTKNTIRKTTVIKTKSYNQTAAKVKIRTNDDAFKQISRIYSNDFDFNSLGFSDLNFGQSLFSVNDKEKRWVEKQYFIYSDEFQKPFGLNYITFAYHVSGLLKKQ